MASNLTDALCGFIENKSVPEDEEKELIKVNTRYTQARYYDADDFKDAVFNYIINKDKLDDQLTDIKNNFQVIKAMNVIYLDGDWTFRRDIDQARYDSLAGELMGLYFDAWCDELSANNFDKYYYFQFIPNSYPNRKGGFHVFIYADVNISLEARLSMYTNIKQKLLHSEKYCEFAFMFQLGAKEDPAQVVLSNTFYEKLFDPQPLKSCQCLIPFAQKDAKSRKYKLYDKDFDSSNVPDWFIIPVTHKVYETVEDDDIVEANETKAYSQGEAANDDLDEMLNRFKQNKRTDFSSLGRVGKMTAEFMLSLRYLSKSHAFWNKLADHDTKLKYIARDLIGFILVNYFIEHRGEAPNNANNQFYDAITRILLPLIKLTTINTNENTERDKFASLYKNIRDYYSKYTDVSCNDHNAGGLFSSVHSAFWKEYMAMTARERHALNSEDSMKLAKIKHFFQKYYGNWFRFLKEILLDGITDEIRPFKEVNMLEDDPRIGVVFDDVMKEQPSVNNKARTEDSFYITTMRRWIRMFIVEEVFNTMSLQETIRSLLTAFCRYYIWYSKSQTGNERLYIYNIRQTKNLCSYPYNQWLLDSNDGDLLKDWTKTIYLAFIKPELLTINKAVGIKYILDNLRVAEIVDNVALEKIIKPLGNFDKDMDTAYKNILSSFAQEYNNPPKELNPVYSNWFPMRNGLLEFVENGEPRFHDNNITRFMNAYTNIVWDPAYDYGCEEYQKIQAMWEQIYPVKEEREYMLKIFASTLNGTILKDMLLILYGGGSDGKTVSNNAIMGMLGSEGFQERSPIQENGKVYYAENPSGLGTTMKTETILVSQKSTHDEGGIVMLKDKRFCTVQEPDPNLSNGYLNCAQIKNILSGTTITGRKIYKAAESFAPNCVITLQTNVLLGYSEDTDGIRRRITVVPYRSKFTTEIAGDKYDTLKYKFQADPQLSSNLVNEPRYWQALFYSMFDYAKELTNNHVKALSDIPRPKSIIRATNKSFMRSNGLVGWLANNIKESVGHVLSMPRLERYIEDANTNEIQSKHGPILNGKKSYEKMNEIYSQLAQTYMGRIYILKSKYYNRNKSDIAQEITESTIMDALEETPGFDSMSDQQKQNAIISTWFKPFAINDISFSRLNMKQDLFIVGYQIAAEMSEEEREAAESNEHPDIELKQSIQAKKQIKAPKVKSDDINEAADFI